MSLVSETQPVDVSVNIKVTKPSETPVTTPESFTVARVGSRLVQWPPETGDKVVSESVQITLFPVILIDGIGNTIIGVGIETHPVMVSVKEINAVPSDIPVTIPTLFINAMSGSKLFQIPKPEETSVVMDPIQTLGVPELVTVGRLFTLTESVVAKQPVDISVNVKLVDPTSSPSTIPSLVTVAIKGLLVVHKPPVSGDNNVFPPKHMDVSPTIDT